MKQHILWLWLTFRKMKGGKLFYFISASRGKYFSKALKHIVMTILVMIKCYMSLQVLCGIIHEMQQYGFFFKGIPYIDNV